MEKPENAIRYQVEMKVLVGLDVFGTHPDETYEGEKIEGDFRGDSWPVCKASGKVVCDTLTTAMT